MNNNHWLLWIILFTLVCDGICIGVFRKIRFMKYVPSILCVIGIAAFAIRFKFFAKGYSGIVDVVMMMVLGISLAISLAVVLIAALIDRWAHR